MAYAKHSGFAAQNQVSRRNLLRAAPAAGLAAMMAGSIPVAAQEESRIVRLFRRHQAIIDAAESYGIGDPNVTDEDMNRLFFNESDAIEAEMMAEPCTCAADFAAKVIVDTSRGGTYTPWETGAIWAEARSLIG